MWNERMCLCVQRPEMMASTETLDDVADSAPQALPYHSNTSTLRSIDSPKREATELYLKSKALLESRRECWLHTVTNSQLRSIQSRRCAWTWTISYDLLLSSTEPHTKDIDIFLKRDIETGFGFRVLGGEGPQQPVSI